MTGDAFIPRGIFGLLALVITVAACSGGSRQPEQPPVPPAPVGFVNKVWRVASSTSVETGLLYVFLSDGTLVVSSPHGRPSLGTWKPDGSGLTMTEEGVSYKVNVLKLSADEFRIMINNPGNAVEIAFAPAHQPAGIPPPAPR
jgi:hypothetical protein